MTRGAMLVTLGVLLGACAPEQDGDGRRTARGTASGRVGEPADSSVSRGGAGQDQEPADSALDAAGGWTAGIVEGEAPASGVAVQRDLRVAAHDDFDRMVLGFGEDAIPGYHIEYVDSPVHACGSGEEVDLPGAGWLSIRLTPAAAHDEQGHATVASRDLPVDLPVILRVRSTCDFEGIVTWVAAVRSPNEYRVLELEAPNRLVVDVRR